MPDASSPDIGRLLRTSSLVRLGELLAVFALPTAAVLIGGLLVGEDPLARQALAWVANVGMLLLVWWGLRLRGQSWAHLGLHLHRPGRRELARVLLLSIVVFAAAVAAFVAGGIAAAGAAESPQQADMSGYTYLQGNLPMLLLALAAVYVVSSFGEEVVYRGFLITRLAELGGGGRWARIAAVAAAAVVFGLAHFDWGVVGIIQTTFMGLALGIAYLLLRRDLRVLILVHVYMDTLLMLQLYAGGP